MLISSTLIALTISSFCGASKLLPYESLAGRSEAEIQQFIRTYGGSGAQPAPPAINDTSAKLVNDKKHPWQALKHGQIRGPCPGLNTLASHGWLPRDGVASPGQIVTAVQEGFNMGWDLAVFVTYAAMLVDGNHVTNLLSIGEKTSLTGPNPPKPAIVGGLNTHGVFEGDASMTRGDAYFGDNHSFNETLFQEFIQASETYGGGLYNLTAASELRYKRILDSMSTNPEFFFSIPRYATAYAESVFPITFFEGDSNTGYIDMKTARAFFQDSHMPDGFHRRNGSIGLIEIGEAFGILTEAHFVEPGQNVGTKDNFTYVVDEVVLEELQGDFLCALYNNFVNKTLELYPNPTGLLRSSIAQNLDNFYRPLATFDSSCEQRFPYN